MKKKLLQSALALVLALCSINSAMAADEKVKSGGVKLKPTITQYDSRDILALLQYEGLVVIDGKPTLDKEIVAGLDADKIKSISSMPTERSVAVFGERAKKGTVEVTLYQEDEEIPAGREVRPTDDKSPLFLLDDKFITVQSIALIDPNSIEKIQVLKDENAISVYGEKGKNGVVLITLKKQKNN